MNHGSLFSGIGGFDLAAQWMGWNNVFHCEWNKFGQQVLKHYWPNAISYEDITKTDFTVHRGAIDILTGGFPCQPYSQAGKQLGKKDNRHLWPEMLRAIREIQPTWVVGENVLGLVNWNGGLVFDEVQADLEAQGYEVQPYVLPACAVNAPHRRDRVWFVAYSGSKQLEKWSLQRNEQNQTEKRAGMDNRIERPSNFRPPSDPNSNGLIGSDCEHEVNTGQGRFDAQRDIEPGFGDGNAADTGKQGLQRCKVNGSAGAIGKDTKKQSSGLIPSTWQNFPTQSPICSRNDGLPTELDGIAIQNLLKGKKPRGTWIPFAKWRNESIKAAGNAIVPQVVYEIFKTIQKYADTRQAKQAN